MHHIHITIDDDNKISVAGIVGAARHHVGDFRLQIARDVNPVMPEEGPVDIRFEISGAIGAPVQDTGIHGRIVPEGERDDLPSVIAGVTSAGSAS